jgi:type I restriction enzyme, R subunit
MALLPLPCKLNGIDLCNHSIASVVSQEGVRVLDEAATCRTYVIPKLTLSGWYDTPHDVLEQKTFTDGRIVAVGRKVKRRPEKRADYLLMSRPDFTIAVVEAKDEYKLPSHGLQQAKEYAEILGLKFAYATNGHGIVEFDYTTGQERVLMEHHFVIFLTLT